MADTSKIEAKPKEPTEAQKAAQSLPEELVSHEQEVQEELRQKHLADGRKSLEETRRSTQDEIGALKLDIPPEQISDLPTLDAMLGLKIEKVPKSVPAYLDMLVEKNPTLFEMP
ncbi:hypothetical protein H6768_03525 [Candidatus Peribacteria bacterium]|nr:hypothetical protein [Candidatus Peribacteria bacterium]